MDTNDKDGPANPPVSGVNIAAHFRELLRALPIALVIAVLVGGGVWLVRDRSERTYEASLTAQISQQSIGAVFNELTQPYIVMITQDRVLSDVVKNGLASSEADLRPRVSAMTGPAPSLLIIKAQADSPVQAERLALAVQQSLDRTASQMRAEAIARSTADLEVHRRVVEDTFTERLADDPLRPELSFDARDVAREIEFRQVLGMARLTVIGSPRSELVAPHPVQEGLFAALATLIIVAEAIVLARGALGRRRSGKPDTAGPTPPDPATAPPAAGAETGPPGTSAAVPTNTAAAAADPPVATQAAHPAAQNRAAPPTTAAPRAAPVPRAHPAPKAVGIPDNQRPAKPSAPYDPETTVLPRVQPVRAAPVPPSTGTRNDSSPSGRSPH
ncbi:hypothetical protein [Nocardia mangyaensis]|uniref:hypothetical protein n=1 Tax=Nocardia mangyaensis TaxID=2213200 RepID=UPI002675B62E|nr:hypothetical protein [Nocardia mangyaensis]MDO3650871.1 hypothetical protein [Nocardia mangyaensis]